MGMLFFIIIGGFIAPQFLYADIDWRVIREIDLKEQPLDLVTALDGKTLFILVPGQVLVHDMKTYEISQRISVGKEFDRLTYSPGNNILILSSSTAKTLKVIQLERIHEFDFSGSPSLGPKDAPVIITVFSDYQ